MKKYSIILISLAFVLFASCSSSKKPANDSDIIPDADSDGSDAENINDDSDSQDADIIDDKDQSDDSDSESSHSDSDSDDCEKTDYDSDFELSDDPYCEEYGEYSDRIAYRFYKDEPLRGNDPENVKDLWSTLCGVRKCCYECEPRPYDLCPSEYPFEAALTYFHYKEGMSSGIKKAKFQCDAQLTPGLWSVSSIATSLQMNLLNGKLQFSPRNNAPLQYDSIQSLATYAYDLDTRKLERIGGPQMEGWQNSRYYFISTYDNRISDNKESPYYEMGYKEFVVYYDKETNTYGYAFKSDETPSSTIDLRASENYLFMSANFRKYYLIDGEEYYSDDERILYTKIGEWDNWKELKYKKENEVEGERRAGYPSMIDDYVVYFDYDLEIQFCDLSKGDEGCFKVSRDDEYGRYPIFKDKNTVIYSSEKKDDPDEVASIVQADISDRSNIKYETLYEWPELYSVQPANVEGDTLLFIRKYLHDGENFDNSSPEGQTYNKDACFYSFAEKTTVCMDEKFDLQMIKDDGYKYKRYYVFHSFADVLVRDLECYCDFYPEKCPLIDYTPNPDNPKEPWKRECGSK